MDIQYVVGDATRPQGAGARLIVHGCNDQGARTRNAERGSRNQLAVWRAFRAPGKVCAWARRPTTCCCCRRSAVRTKSADDPVIRSAFRVRPSDFGTPRLGCGLAGGDWPRIAALIADELLTQGIAVTVYDPAPGGPAYARH